MPIRFQKNSFFAPSSNSFQDIMLALSKVGSRRQLRWASSVSTNCFSFDSSRKAGGGYFRISYPAQREKSSSASVINFPIPNSLRETVKTSILDQAARDDSKAWKDKSGVNGSDSVNDEISSMYDPLDDLYPVGNTRYWPNPPPTVQLDADPFSLSQIEVENLSKSIRNDLLGSEHPVLTKAASYFFDSADGGKKIRPMMVMLLSRALANTLEKSSQNDNSLFTMPLPQQRQDLPEAQRRLAEISEMIHTASLFHDDVIDGSDTRRGMPSLHMVFGNKMAILAGDYLLARASICLARLRNVEVVETMSTIIEHLVRGEVMQIRGTSSMDGANESMVYYLKKNFFKTASLMANSCKSAALLADCPPELAAASYKYGKHVGMAFQLVDDVLDYEGSITSMGKPALADLKAGLATAPVMFSARIYPELEEMMDRKFSNEGDVELARQLVFESDGLEQTKHLARLHAELAMEALLELEDSPHRDALINLAYKVVSRTK
jgi:geranylgeranyl pyrophosphate synthase